MNLLDRLRLVSYPNRMETKREDIAWLAGFWDGEGSIGLVRNKTTRILSVQLSHTEFNTIEHILRILKSLRINGRGYTYQERDPAKHRDAHYIRVSGIANILKLSVLMLPHAVTKRRHWEIAIEWARRRIKVAGGVDGQGHLRRGGMPGGRAYSTRDIELADELAELNQRGPMDRARRTEGRIVA